MLSNWGECRCGLAGNDGFICGVDNCLVDDVSVSTMAAMGSGKGGGREGENGENVCGVHFEVDFGFVGEY
jgi:hypothetical protein